MKNTKIVLDSMSVKSWGDYFDVEVYNEYGGGNGQIHISEAHQLHTWLTTQLGLGWVSVDDRLPELEDGFSEMVLLSLPTKYGTNYANGFYNKEWGWRRYQSESDISMNCKPSHWRPLPQPPEVNE